MRIQKQDLFYGPVLQQIAEYPVFTEVNRVTDKQGVYRINDYTLLIKYSAEDGPEWSFSFTSSDLALLNDVDHDPYVAFNCGNDAICLLSKDQLFSVIDSESTSNQAVKVRCHEGSSMRVKGPLGDLGHTVAHNAFPGVLLGKVSADQEPYAKPEFSRMAVYRELPHQMFSTTDRLEDLADRLGRHVGPGALTVYLGLSTLSHKWPNWTDEKLKTIEQQIKYDLGFDGMNVKIHRHTQTVIPGRAKLYRHHRGSDEFLWKLIITA